MNPVAIPELQEIVKSVYYRPAVSIIVPFEPKMTEKSGLVHSLKVISGKVENDLRHEYPAVICRLMMQKINAIINNLNYSTHKKSIAIFVSPVFEKVLYLEIPVKEKVIVNGSFEIRDILYCKKQLRQYLALFLSRTESRIYLAKANRFEQIVLNMHYPDFTYVNEAKERVSNFTDISSHKETLMDKFLLHTDHVLDTILKAYHLPLFVFGATKTLGHFKRITRHTEFIIEFVDGNYMNAKPEDLAEIMQSHIADWNEVREKYLLNQLEAAAGRNKLAVGIRNVWRQANNHNGRLLLVEKDFVYTSQHDRVNYINKTSDTYNPFSHIRDEVDDIIEKVLANGGDAEFVDNEVLKDYRHIALLQFY